GAGAWFPLRNGDRIVTPDGRSWTVDGLQEIRKAEKPAVGYAAGRDGGTNVIARSSDRKSGKKIADGDANDAEPTREEPLGLAARAQPTDEDTQVDPVIELKDADLVSPQIIGADGKVLLPDVTSGGIVSQKTPGGTLWLQRGAQNELKVF